jgi:hypothetical protein
MHRSPTNLTTAGKKRSSSNFLNRPTNPALPIPPYQCRPTSAPLLVP